MDRVSSNNFKYSRNYQRSHTGTEAFALDRDRIRRIRGFAESSGYKRTAHLVGPKNLSVSKFRFKSSMDAVLQGNFSFTLTINQKGG